MPINQYRKTLETMADIISLRDPTLWLLDGFQKDVEYINHAWMSDNLKFPPYPIGSRVMLTSTEHLSQFNCTIRNRVDHITVRTYYLIVDDLPEIPPDAVVQDDDDKLILPDSDCLVHTPTWLPGTGITQHQFTGIVAHRWLIRNNIPNPEAELKRLGF